MCMCMHMLCMYMLHAHVHVRCGRGCGTRDTLAVVPLHDAQCGFPFLWNRVRRGSIGLEPDCSVLEEARHSAVLRGVAALCELPRRWRRMYWGVRRCLACGLALVPPFADYPDWHGMELCLFCQRAMARGWAALAPVPVLSVHLMDVP